MSLSVNASATKAPKVKKSYDAHSILTQVARGQLTGTGNGEPKLTGTDVLNASKYFEEVFKTRTGKLFI